MNLESKFLGKGFWILRLVAALPIGYWESEQSKYQYSKGNKMTNLNTRFFY